MPIICENTKMLFFFFFEIIINSMFINLLNIKSLLFIFQLCLWTMKKYRTIWEKKKKWFASTIAYSKFLLKSKPGQYEWSSLLIISLFDNWILACYDYFEKCFYHAKEYFKICKNCIFCCIYILCMKARNLVKARNDFWNFRVIILDCDD